MEQRWKRALNVFAPVFESRRPTAESTDHRNRITNTYIGTVPATLEEKYSSGPFTVYRGANVVTMFSNAVPL